MSDQQPSLFVPHGAPTFALRPGAAGAALTRLSAQLTRPRAIVVVSPHWETDVPTVGFADRLETIYDFWGFPEALYSQNYPATGCREAAEEVVKALSKADFPVKKDDQRGLDHGAWVPLRMMFPDADIPVIPLSIQHQGGPAHHFKVGQALASLANQGFLIIGTGSITHNLRDYQIAVQQGRATPVYVREFADWVADRIASKQTDELINYRQAAAYGRQAHPREDHLLPLLVALGAADAQATSERVHAGIDDFVIAMDAYAFWPAH